MPFLENILAPVSVVRLIGPGDVAIQGLTFDSRQATYGKAFFAVRGAQADGHAFIDKAIAAGCSVIICEHLPNNLNPLVTYVQVNDSG